MVIHNVATLKSAKNGYPEMENDSRNPEKLKNGNNLTINATIGISTKLDNFGMCYIYSSTSGGPKKCSN